jgi:hypothetical protein
MSTHLCFCNERSISRPEFDERQIMGDKRLRVTADHLTNHWTSDRFSATLFLRLQRANDLIAQAKRICLGRSLTF